MMLTKIRVSIGLVCVFIGMRLYGFSNEEIKETAAKWIKDERERLSRAARGDIDIFADENLQAFTIIERRDKDA